MTAHDAESGLKGGPCCDRWIELQRSLAERYAICNDGLATPSNILLAVLNAVADANRVALQSAIGRQMDADAAKAGGA